MGGSCTSSHWPVVTLSGQSVRRTSSSRISAAVREARRARRPQPPEVVSEREPERGRALPDLERREGVDVSQRLLHGRADLQVRLAGERGVDAALEAELDGAAVPASFARRTISSSGTT